MSGAFGRVFALFRARVVNSTPSKAANSVFKGLRVSSLSLSLSLVAALGLFSPAFAASITGSTDAANPKDVIVKTTGDYVQNGYFGTLTVLSGKNISTFNAYVKTSPITITKLLNVGSFKVNQTNFEREIDKAATIKNIKAQRDNEVQSSITITTLTNSFATINRINFNPDSHTSTACKIGGTKNPCKLTIGTLTNFIGSITNINAAEIGTLTNGYKGKIGTGSSDGINGKNVTITTLNNIGGKEGIVYINNGKVDKINNGGNSYTVDASYHIENADGTWTLVTNNERFKSSDGLGVLVINGGTINTLNANYAKDTVANLNGGTVTTLNYSKGTLNFNGSTVTALNNSSETGLIIDKDVTIGTLTNTGNSSKLTITGTLTDEVKNSNNFHSITVTFAKNPNADALGQVVGTFKNTSANFVKVDATGLTMGKDYVFINGT